jgi:hypothetical protein
MVPSPAFQSSADAISSPGVLMLVLLIQIDSASHPLGWTYGGAAGCPHFNPTPVSGAIISSISRLL